MDNLDLAIQLAAQGWRVFPCREKPGTPYKNKKGETITPEEKSPYTAGSYFDAVTDFDAVYRLWKRYPNALVGIACGLSGLLVLDFDRHPDKPDGLKTLEKLLHENGETSMPCGPSQRTAGGGMHAFFALPAMPDDWEMPGTLGPGIDIKAHGYVCTGTLQDGRSYLWRDGHDYDAPLTLPPAWVLRIIAKRNAPQAKPALPRQAAVTTAGDEARKAQEALRRLSPRRADEYAEWLRVGMALKSLGAVGLDLWHEFSRQSPKYSPDVLDAKWEGFAPRKIHLASLFYWARQDSPQGR